MTKERLRRCRKENAMGLDTSAFTGELLDEIEQLNNDIEALTDLLAEILENNE